MRIENTQTSGIVTSLGSNKPTDKTISHYGAHHTVVDESPVVVEMRLYGLMDYSKEDAITKGWNSRHDLFQQITLDEITIDGKPVIVNIDNTNFTAEEKLSILEKDGLSGDIAWATVGLDFEAVTASINRNGIKDTMSYFASMYVAFEEQINRNYTGEERETQLATLENTVDSYVKQSAEMFSDEYGGFLEKYDAKGERDKIYDSVIGSFNTAVDAYKKFENANSDYANIQGTSDEWLQNDANYMASMLRQQGVQAPTSHEDIYNLGELNDIQAIVGEMKMYSLDSISNRHIGAWDSEQKLGLKLSTLMLKADMITGKSSSSQSLKNAIYTATTEFIEDFLSTLDTQMNKASGSSGLPQDVKGFASLDKNSVYEVINYVLDTYKQTGDAKSALLSGSYYAIAEFKVDANNPSNSGVYRYSGDNFYDYFEYQKRPPIPGLTMTHTGGNYEPPKSEFQIILDSFKDFEENIGLAGKSSLYTGVDLMV